MSLRRGSECLAFAANFLGVGAGLVAFVFHHDSILTASTQVINILHVASTRFIAANIQEK